MLKSSLFLAVSTVLLAACSRLTPERAGESGTFTAVYNDTLTSCTRCHQPGGSAFENGVALDFTSQAAAYQTLLGNTVGGASSVGICGGVREVDPGSPASSYLIGVLLSSYHFADFAGHAGCLPYSAHLQDQNLSEAEQASLVAWVQAGAPNN